MIRPEYTAICIWLLCETLNIQSSAGEAGLTKICYAFPKHVSFEPRNLNWISAESRSDLPNSTEHLSLPLCSLWENRNVKRPASAASGKTQCLQINSEILVLNCLGAWLWREPLRHSQLQLETVALQWFAFFFFGCPQSLPFLRCLVFCAGEGASVMEHQALHSSALWQCRFLTVFPLGREGRNTSVPAVSWLWRHCMLFSLLYTWPAHARKRWNV